MERARTPIAIAIGTAILGGLGLVGFKLAAGSKRAEVAAVDDEPATVRAARQVS